MSKVGVVVAQITKPASDTKVLVLEGIRTADRPAAIGYFLLDIAREWYARFHEFPHIDIQLGHVDSSELIGTDYRTSLAMRGDWYGRIYELTLAVERNDRRPFEPERRAEDGDPTSD